MVECRREVLANGLRVLCVRMPSLHSAIAIAYLRMGPRFETPEQNGLSHFVEHVLFKGTERFPDPEALSRAIDAHGLELNGATMPEYTEVVAGAHSRHFAHALALLAEVLLHPRFAEEHVEIERKVVLEEMGQYRDMTGDGVSIDELAQQLMWPEHAHAFRCLGTEANVARLHRDDLEAHYRRFLTARNLVLCVAGNFAEADVMGQLGDAFGALEAGEPVACARLDDDQAAPRHLFRAARTQMAYLKLCHKACSYHDPRVYPVVVISDILGGGVTSRLFSRLRERDGLVYDVSAGTTLFSDCGWVEVATTTSRGKVAATVEAAAEEVHRLADEGIAEEQLQIIKERVACNMEILEDSPPDVAEWLGVREILLSPERVVTPTDEAERLKQVTAEEILRTAREVFQPARRSLVVVGPTSWLQRRRIRRAVAR
ncbi:MAG TPA: pitrilysin family protein [Planctomycetota bacterium]|nr:pitrilysin family protein [Planctomycetota bacterium]